MRFPGGEPHLLLRGRSGGRVCAVVAIPAESGGAAPAQPSLVPVRAHRCRIEPCPSGTWSSCAPASRPSAAGTSTPPSRPMTPWPSGAPPRTSPIRAPTGASRSSAASSPTSPTPGQTVLARRSLEMLCGGSFVLYLQDSQSAGGGVRGEEHHRRSPPPSVASTASIMPRLRVPCSIIPVNVLGRADRAGARAGCLADLQAAARLESAGQHDAHRRGPHRRRREGRRRALQRRGGGRRKHQGNSPEHAAEFHVPPPPPCLPTFTTHCSHIFTSSDEAQQTQQVTPCPASPHTTKLPSPHRQHGDLERYYKALERAQYSRTTFS